MKTMVFVILLFSLISLRASDSTESHIMLRTYLEQDDVPLNREVVYHVELSWEGDLQRYHITSVSEPVLNNLKLRGSGSSNRFFTDEQGKPHSVKRITYYFTPIEIGMAYIDGVSVHYEDKNTLQKETLSAQRLGLKIIQREADADAGIDTGNLIIVVVSALFLLVLIYFISKYFRIRKLEQNEQIIELTVEQRYQQELSLLLKETSVDAKPDFNALIHLLTRYLSEKYKIVAGTPYKEVKLVLQSQDIPPELLNKLEKLYRQGELSKFAGENISEADFHLFADTVEMVISNVNEESKENK